MASEPPDKALIAQVSLAHVLDHRRPQTYLRRNLTRVLDCHERQCLLDRSDVTADKDTAPGQPNTTDISRSRMRIFPQLSDGMMRDLISSHRPTLTITALSLRVSSPSPMTTSEDLSGSATRPSWLPDPNEFRLPCQITAAIYDKPSSASDRKQIWLDLRQGTLTGKTRGPNGQVFDVRLDEPFRLDVDKMSLITSSSPGVGPWKRELIANTILDIGIQFGRSEDAAAFLSIIEGRDVKQYQNTPHSDGILRALWTKLPELPEAGELLPLTRAQGKKSVDLRYGVKVHMGWNQQRSPITHYNQVSQRDMSEPRQLPTPSSEDLDESMTPCNIKYLYSSAFRERSAVTDDLKCPLCPTRGAQSSFERLRLHFLTHHGYLHFQVENNNEDHAYFRVVRIIAKEDRQWPKVSAFDWRAPSKPFNIADHLDGRSVWYPDDVQGPRQKNATPKKARGRAPKDTPELPAEMVTVKRAKRKILPADAVEDLPIPKRRKHEVPEVPGINFYRTTSKRQVKPGTILNESDEEPDESWFAQANRRGLSQLDLDNGSRDFVEAFNRHLDNENPMSDTLTRDAVIRFARKHCSNLCQRPWRHRFDEKLKQLESRRVIGTDTVEYCSQVLVTQVPVNAPDMAPKSPVKASSSKTLTRRSDDKGSRKVTGEADDPIGFELCPVDDVEKSSQYGKSPATPGRSKENGGVGKGKAAAREKSVSRNEQEVVSNGKSCTCGEIVHGVRGTIACANASCGREFHMQCVQLPKRALDWRCRDCNS